MQNGEFVIFVLQIMFFVVKYYVGVFFIRRRAAAIKIKEMFCMKKAALVLAVLMVLTACSNEHQGAESSQPESSTESVSEQRETKSSAAESLPAQDAVYVPTWMQPYTVIVYDDELNYTIIQGGELIAEDIEGREDIAAVGLESQDPDMIAKPNIKVEYDLHGFIQNIYYPVPGQPGEYQLQDPDSIPAD